VFVSLRNGGGLHQIPTRSFFIFIFTLQRGRLRPLRRNPSGRVGWLARPSRPSYELILKLLETPPSDAEKSLGRRAGAG